MSKQDPRYKKFVHNYFYGGQGIIGNALQSARKAGFAGTTSEKKAPSWVAKNREHASNKVIWDMIQAERAKFENDYDMSEEEILKQYKRLATFDIRKLYDPQGQPIPIHLLDDDTAAAVCAVDLASGQADGVFVKTTKIKMADRKATLDSIAKIKGMFEKDNKQKNPSFAEVFQSLMAVSPELAQAVKEHIFKNVG